MLAFHRGQRAYELNESVGGLFLGKVIIAMITDEDSKQRAFKVFDQPFVGRRISSLMSFQQRFV